MRHREHASAKPGLCAVGKVQCDRYSRTGRPRRSDHFQVHHRRGPGRDRAMPRRSRPYGAAFAGARGPSSSGRPVIDRRGQLLRAALGFARCSMPSYDRALWALRTWLDSWSGIGHVAVEMAHPRAATLEKRVVRPRVWVLALLACVVACASPATKTSDTPIASEEPRPSFAPGGPDAEEFGASMGYPKGNPATFRSTRSLVSRIRSRVN